MTQGETAIERKKKREIAFSRIGPLGQVAVCSTKSFQHKDEEEIKERREGRGRIRAGTLERESERVYLNTERKRDCSGSTWDTDRGKSAQNISSSSFPALLSSCYSSL